ncbi:pentatricopeptide repeat-containing protein At1g51965, mitochondrial isoform X2 [Malania oleifera]|uniref:pentatricopeptide repeat-containing protein At1g51965, mitochondrial isoform X2 n=1 Tax=Malania oleifera TaxID=397392 RepID=UPI0025AE19AB|nr:pentatricopeptide repeat-containing protein At1g51965, mitochondrial isoform X2 [Malania oleifera]
MRLHRLRHHHHSLHLPLSFFTNNRRNRRCFATKYTARVVSSAADGRSLAVEVDSPTLPTDIRGYAVPRRDLICKATRILLQPPSATSDPCLDLADYFHTLSLSITPSEASEILKSLNCPRKALEFFRFCPSHIPGFRHDAFSYNRLLLILSKSLLPDRLDLVRRIVDEMERSGVRGTISTVNILIGIFGSADLERCSGLIEKWGLRFNCYTYKCLLQAYLRSHDTNKAYEVYVDMRRRGYKLDIFAYNMLLDALAKEEKEMIEKGISPNFMAYNTMIQALAKSQMVDKTIFLFSKMVENNCRPNEFTYSVILNVLASEGQLGRLDEIVEVSKKYMNKSIYAYLVRTLSKLGHASEAHRLFCNMWSFHDKGDRDAYKSMLESLCSAGKMTEALELLSKIHEKGINTDTIMYNTVFSALGKLKQVSHLLDLYEKMKRDGPSPDIFTYNILISSFGRAGRVDEAVKIFEELENSDCKPDIISYNSLINCLGKNGNLDEAHIRFKEMQEKGLSPDVVTYSTLIECFGKTDKVEMACSLFDEMLANGCHPNIVTYNILLDCLDKCGRAAQAVDLYAKLKQQGLTPDSITYAVLDRLQSGSHRTVRVRKKNPITGWVVSPL